MANPPRTPSRTSALFAAAARGNLSSLRIVLEHGVGEGLNVDSPNSRGDTPLHEACRNRQWPIAAWLLAHGANPDLVNAFGQDASDVCPDAAAKDIYASILASNPIDASDVASFESTLESARARRAQEELEELERELLGGERAANEVPAGPAATTWRPTAADGRADGDSPSEFSFERAATPEAMGGHRVIARRMEADFDANAPSVEPSPNAASPPRMSAIDAAMESAMKRAKEVLRASPEDLLRAARAGAAADDDDDDPLSPEMFAHGSNADGTAMASAIKAELRSARKNMAEIRRRIDEEIAVASSPKRRTSVGSRTAVRRGGAVGGDDDPFPATETPPSTPPGTPGDAADLLRRMFGPAPRISVDGKRLDGDDDDDLEEASDPEEEVPIRRGVIRKAALAVTEQGVKLQHARRRIADLENAMKERDEFEANAREHLRSAEESARQLRTLSERLESEKKELARSEARRAELERDLDTVRGELETERGARRDAEARVVANGWDADDAKRSADQSRMEERRSAVAFAELTARLEDSRATLASTEAALREARYGLQTECNRAAASEAELFAVSTERDQIRLDFDDARKELETLRRGLEDASERAATFEARSEAFATEVESLKRRLAASKAQTTSALELGESAGAAVDRLELECQKRNAECARLAEENERLRKNADEEIERARKNADDRAAAFEAGEARARDLESKLRTTSADLDFVKARLEGAERERDCAENLLKESGAETERLRDLKEATALELGKNRALSESVFVLTEKLAAAEAELDATRAARDALGAEHESAKLALSTAHDAEEARRQRALRRVAGRLMHRGKSSAFARWREVADDAERARAALRRALGKFANASLAKAMARWRECLDSARESERAERLLKRHFGRFAGRSKACAFGGWRDEAKKARRLKVLGQKLLGRFDARFVRRLFQNWKVHLAQASKRNRVLGRVVDRMRGRVVSAAFDKWRGFIVERERLRRRIGRVLARFADRARARAFDKWASTVAERAAVRASLARTLARFANRAVAAAFATWTDSVTEARRLRSTLARVASRFSNRTLSAAWERWAELVREKRRMANALDRVVRKMRNRVVAGAFATWIDAVAESERLKAVLRRVAGKFANRRLAASWETWVATVAESERLRALLRKVAGKFANRRLAASWETWATACEARRAEDEERKRTASKVVARLAKSSLHRAFGRWAENVLEKRAAALEAEADERRRADVLNRAVRRLANRALAGAFATWRRAVDDSRRARLLELEDERVRLLGEREEVGSAVFENGRLTERVEALAAELESAKARISSAEARAEEAARAAARERVRARKVSDDCELIRKNAAARESELRIELASSGAGVGKNADAATVRELKARCRDLKAENKRAKDEIERVTAEAKKSVDDLNARLERANEAATKAKSARIRARKAGEARTQAEEDLAAANALGDALSAELREREEELRRAEASLAASREETRTVARAERDAASLLLEGKRVWESLERALRDQIDAAEARRLEAESRLASVASTAERRVRLAEEEAHELREQAQTQTRSASAGDDGEREDVESLRAKLQRALADAAAAEERASDAEAATRSAEAKIESMRWPKSLTSPGRADSDLSGRESSLVDRAADQRVATLRWYAAALNSRRASAVKRVASLEADLKKEMKRSEDAKRAMLEAAAGVRQRAMDAEADAAARHSLETDLAKLKADLAKARRMNVEGQMTRSSLRIELAEAKASAEALAKAMADAELPTDTPDAHRAREETVKRAATERGAAYERTSYRYAAFTPPASPQFMSPTVVSATKTVSGFYAKTPSRASSGAAINRGQQPRQPSPRRGDLRDPRAARPIDHPPGVGHAAHKPRTQSSDAAFRDILVGAADYSTDVPHALLRARLHAAHRAAHELRARCAEHAAAAASAKAEAANASVEAADAARAATEATAALAESTRHKSALESRVERAEGAVAAAESAAVDARSDAAASEADAAAARALLRVVVAREFKRSNSDSVAEESNADESNAVASPNPPQSAPRKDLDDERRPVDEDDDDLAMIRARLQVAEDAVSEALESRASSERALAEGASALAAVIAERNALAARCDACVAELGDARAWTARASAEVFELRLDADAQRRRGDECESIANRLDAELEALIKTSIKTSPHGASDGTYRRRSVEGVEAAALGAALAVNRARLAHARSAMRASEAEKLALAARVNDAEDRAKAAVADAERARAALRDARAFVVYASGGERSKADEEEEEEEEEEGDSIRRLEELEADRAALTSKLVDATRERSALEEVLNRERAKCVGERARADAASAALEAFASGWWTKPSPEEGRGWPAGPSSPEEDWSFFSTAAAAAAERARCFAIADANVELHARVAELVALAAAKANGRDDDANGHDDDDTKGRDEAADRAASAASSTAANLLRDLGVAVDATDAAAAARDAAATAAALKSELVEVTRALEGSTLEAEALRREMSAERERETRRRSRAEQKEDTKGSTERKGDPNLVGARLAEAEARLAAANARIAFLESALVRNGASAKDGTPLGTPLGTPAGTPTGTPAGTPPNSAARANTSNESLEDLRARLRSATRRADAAEAAAAEAEAAADAASHAAADADAACAGIRDAANARARAAEARAADAEERAAALADAIAGVEDAAAESVELRAELVKARTDLERCRGETAVGRFEAARETVQKLAAGDVDGAIAKAEAAMDASRDAARVWSERVASGGHSPETLGERARELLDAGGVAGRAREIMADALAQEMAGH
ncbi:predicted protein [Micromonas commoda]|uniref:Uncharacterized protein n=1 Tax=Micromonas commoda (strain RCC299 / NOUM17 / CCMP2709) TaxID=296587 RepID=C1FGK8_MICCC|nr:predicted protein [Micromonas commoda]ACO69280.1 predicted protein [Micromonas commoda]|eukprot:XP_002508022.1 predicted protein [Micromonas commoda]